MQRKIPKSKQGKPPAITPEILARARQLNKDFSPPLEHLVPREHVFAPYHPAPGVIPEKEKLAFDQWSGEVSAWGAQNLWDQGGFGYGGGIGWEGFIGYPELSVLALRPEYRRISEVIATECVRKWIKFESVSERKKAAKKIKHLNDALDKFRVKYHFQKLIETDGFFGRGHLFVDLGNSQDRDELRSSIGDGQDKISQAKIARGSLKKLKVIEPIWTYPTNYNAQDPLSETWYRPEEWFVMGKAIHSTRLLSFIAREVPDILKPAFNFGGLSLSQMCIPYVNNWLKTRASVNAIISAFSCFVLATNLSTTLSADGDQLFSRAQLFNLIRDNRNLMMIDKDSEDFKNVAAPLGSLDKLQAQAQEHMAAVSGIPLVKLLGITPSGLNASSEGEIRCFYDTIGAFQEKVVRPPLTVIIDIIQLSEFGEVDEDITFIFKPLWSLNELDEATRRKTGADTHAVYIEAGVVDQEEVREVIANEPDSPYAHLDPEDVPEEEPINEMGQPFNARKTVANPQAIPGQMTKPAGKANGKMAAR